MVQLTPPGSVCSIGIGAGVPAYEGTPGAIQDVGGGVKYAEIIDPDGNSFVLQEMAWRTGAKS